MNLERLDWNCLKFNYATLHGRAGNINAITVNFVQTDLLHYLAHLTYGTFCVHIADGNSKLTWQSDCVMWLLCLEVVRGQQSLGLGSVGFLLKFCRLLLSSMLPECWGHTKHLNLSFGIRITLCIPPMTVWPSLGRKAHGNFNHSGICSIRTMLLSLTFSILN